MFSRTLSTGTIIPYSSNLKKTKSFDSIQEIKKTTLIYLLSYFLFKKKEDHELFLKRLFKMNIIKENEISDIFLRENLKYFQKYQSIENEIPYPFSIKKKIGEGSFGQVFLCSHNIDEKEYAIKKISIEDKNEIKILSSLYHPNIIRYFSSWEYSNYFYIQMEYCFSSLRDYLYKEERNPTFLKQILNGLDYLHNMSYIHFDLKPENILISKDGIIKIADFGYSRSILSSIYQSHYYEPSLYICSDDILYESSIDIYSFGIIFLEYCIPYCKTDCEKFLKLRDLLAKREWNLENENYNKIAENCLVKIQKNRWSISKILEFL